MRVPLFLNESSKDDRLVLRMYGHAPIGQDPVHHSQSWSLAHHPPCSFGQWLRFTVPRQRSHPRLTWGLRLLSSLLHHH